MKSYLGISVAAAALLATSNMSSFAQTNTDTDDEAAVQETITVLGSRRAGRSADDTIAPIDVISADELNRQGDVDLLNVLRTSVPSFNVNEQPISDAATLVRPANLRGLPLTQHLFWSTVNAVIVQPLLPSSAAVSQMVPKALTFRSSLQLLLSRLKSYAMALLPNTALMRLQAS